MIEIRELTPEELEQMAAEDEADRKTHALTEEDLEPLKAWAERAELPGDFLQAVLRNDLMMAAGRADLRNRRRLFEYVQWLYNEAPGPCWGSPEAVATWPERLRRKV